MWIANYLAVVAVALLVQGAYTKDMKLPRQLRKAIERYKVAAAKEIGVQMSPHDVSDVLDGDEALDLEMAQMLDDSLGSRQRRKAMKFDNSAFEKYKWTENPIEYNIDSNIDADGRRTIRQALGHIQSQTCLRFSAKNNPSVNYIHFKRASSTVSNVGRQTEKLEQKNFLSSVDIRNKGEIVHQVCHAIGMWHEHQRPDRDNYIRVVNENVENGEAGDFTAIPNTVINTANLPYDYTSVMHFHGKTRSKSDQPTLVAKDPLYQMTMGQRVGLSFLDAKLINLMYCGDKCSSTRRSKACQHGGYADPNNCNSCMCPDGFSGTYCEDLAPSVGQSCGGVLNAIPKEQQITSPGYGSAYEHNQECTWRIKAPATGKVQVKFSGDFSIFSPGGVCQHWVEIRNKVELGTYGPRFCGNDKPTTVLVSEGDEILVLFRAKYKNNQLSASSVGQHGFKLLYKAVNVAVSPCRSITCQNGGSCDEQTYKCICPGNFSGDLCETGGEIHMDPCNSSPCVNGGTCMAFGTGYTCTCRQPFEGINCEEASCGGCGGLGGTSHTPCYGDNIGATEKCNVMEEYTYYTRGGGWWGRRVRCRGYRRVEKNCLCCANSVLIQDLRSDNVCAATGWSDWGPCSDDCGGGVQYKRRYAVVNQERWWGGSSRQLIPAEEESRECNTQECTGWERWYYGPRRRWGYRCCYGYTNYGGRCKK